MMVVTLILYTAYLSCQIGGAAHGTGRHRKDITDANAEKALRFWYFCEIFYTLSTCVLKIAVGLFLLRITIIPIHIWIIRMIMVVACVLGCAYTSLVIFQCKPVSFWWDLNPDHTGSCLSPALVTNMTFAVVCQPTAQLTLTLKHSNLTVSLPLLCILDLPANCCVQ